jgi:hypothetical protein
MTLPWVRLETSIATNHKILALVERNKHRAVSVYVFGLAYCGANETDGYIRKSALPFIHARAAEARDLVEVGLWAEFGGGWVIPDWAEYQMTKEHNDLSRGRAKRAICERWMRKGNPCTCGQHDTARITERITESNTRTDGRTD